MWVCPLNTKQDLVCLLTLSPLYCWITSPTSQQNTVQSLNVPQEGHYMHKKSTERKTLWDRQTELRQLPKQTVDPGRMAYL